jgi:FlaA1/EpsC-like NDP-sugar epimerase
MLGRKQELNLQLQQIVDGVILVVAFWAAHTLRYVGTGWPVLERPIGPFSEFQWLLFVIMPFGPIVLELQGFYMHPLQKTLRKSLEQLARGAFWLGLLIAGCAFFLRLDVPSRAIMPFFAIFAAAGLLIRERISVSQLRQRAHREALRERVILAGTPQDVAQFRQTFTPEQEVEMDVVFEIDIERSQTEELVEALHKYSVSRVMFAGGHSHLNRLQEAITACEIEGVEAVAGRGLR